MKSEYLKALLNKINNGKEYEIEQELSDHIALNHDYFCNKGFDDNESSYKADEVMGDAEVAAMQFSALANERKRNELLITAVCFILAVFVFVYSYLNSKNSYFSYFDYSVITIIHIGFLFVSFVSLKAKLFYHSVIMLIGEAYIIMYVKKPYFINLVNGFIHKNNIYKSFFLNGYNKDELLKGNGAEWSFVILFLLLIAIISFFEFRRRKLKTSRFDIKLIKGICICMYVMIASVVMIYAITSIKGFAFYNTAKATSILEIKECNEAVVENIHTNKAKNLKLSYCYIFKGVSNNTYTVDLHSEVVDYFGRQLKTKYDLKQYFIFDDKAVTQDYNKALSVLKELPLLKDLSEYKKLNSEKYEYIKVKDSVVQVFENSNYYIIVQEANEYFPLRKYLIYGGEEILKPENLERAINNVKVGMSKEELFVTCGTTYAFEYYINDDESEVIGLYFSTGKGYWVKKYYCFNDNKLVEMR